MNAGFSPPNSIEGVEVSLMVAQRGDTAAAQTWLKPRNCRGAEWKLISPGIVAAAGAVKESGGKETTRREGKMKSAGVFIRGEDIRTDWILRLSALWTVTLRGDRCDTAGFIMSSPPLDESIHYRVGINIRWGDKECVTTASRRPLITSPSLKYTRF